MIAPPRSCQGGTERSLYSGEHRSILDSSAIIRRSVRGIWSWASSLPSPSQLASALISQSAMRCLLSVLGCLQGLGQYTMGYPFLAGRFALTQSTDRALKGGS